MEGTSRIVILNELRRKSWIITMYNRENFQVTSRHKLLRNIVTVFIFTGSLIMFGLVLVTSVWFCFECNFNIKETSLAIPISICVVQMVGMYISLAINNRKITQLIDHLQKIIEKRELFLQVSTIKKMPCDI